VRERGLDSRERELVALKVLGDLADACAEDGEEVGDRELALAVDLDEDRAVSLGIDLDPYAARGEDLSAEVLLAADLLGAKNAPKERASCGTIARSTPDTIKEPCGVMIGMSARKMSWLFSEPSVLLRSLTVTLIGAS
jgi:hypothetical protein